MGVLLFFIANCAVLFSAIAFSSRLKLNTISDRILAILIFSISQIVLTELLLGAAFERLYAFELLIFNIMVFVFSLVLNRGKIVKGIKSIDGYNLKELLFILVKSPLVMALSVIALFQIAIIVYLGLNLPPFGWDEIWYHLTAVASWHQEGKIFMLPTPSIWLNQDFVSTLTSAKMAYHMSVAGFWYNVYPMNSELISLWNIIFIGNDWIVDLTQLPFAILGIISVYSLARKIGLNEKSSVIAGLIFLMTPIIIIQSKTAYVDITFGVMTIIAANFLIGFIKYKEPHYALMTAFTSGLVLGTKSSGVVFAGIFIIALLVIEIINNRPGINIKKLVVNAFLFGSIAMALGGFWYFRNLYYYGNPIYPYIVKAAGMTVFPGLGTVNSLIMTHNTPPDYFNSSNIMNIISSWLEKDPLYSVDIRKAGFGALWVVIEVPSIIFFTLLAIKNKIKPALIIILIFGLLFLIHPSNWWTRYTIFIIALGSVSTAYLLERFSIFTKASVSAIIILLSIYTVITTLPYISVIDIRHAVKIPIEKRTIGSTLFADYLWVDSLEDGKRIGFSPMTFTYPLFSPTFKNKVYMVDGNTKEEWVRSIKSNDADYVTVLKGYLYYDSWAQSQNDYLTKIYDGRQLRVYKVKKESVK